MESKPGGVGAGTDINNQGEVVGVVAIGGLTGWHSPDNPTVGGVAAATLIDFFYCNAAGACMHVGSPVDPSDPLARIRINELGVVVIASDLALTLYQ